VYLVEVFKERQQVVNFLGRTLCGTFLGVIQLFHLLNHIGLSGELRRPLKGGRTISMERFFPLAGAMNFQGQHMEIENSVGG